MMVREGLGCYAPMIRKREVGEIRPVPDREFREAIAAAAWRAGMEKDAPLIEAAWRADERP